MEYVGGPPACWQVRLWSGPAIEVWADSYGVEDGTYTFEVLVRATADGQKSMRVGGRTPTDPERVLVVVATIPVTEVELIQSMGSWDGPPAKKRR